MAVVGPASVGLADPETDLVVTVCSRAARAAYVTPARREKREAPLAGGKMSEFFGGDKGLPFAVFRYKNHRVNTLGITPSCVLQRQA